MEKTWESAAIMPVFLRYKGWRFHIYAGDSTLRPHIHIQKGKPELKVWLDTLETARNIGVSKRDESMLLKKVKQEQDKLMEAWNEHMD
jgi:uncharacterized protein (UPF0128 family)